MLIGMVGTRGGGGCGSWVVAGGRGRVVELGWGVEDGWV